jgi:hypothetical protein
MKTEYHSRPMTLRFMRVSAILVVFLLLPGFAPQHSGSPSLAALPQSNLIPAVVYVDNIGHIHELALKGTWQDRDLTSAASAPSVAAGAQPMAFRRSDGLSMIIYLGADLNIHALYLELVRQPARVYWLEVWHHANLTVITTSPQASSDPFGYVRSDGISTVVYCGTDAEIHDLRLESVWIHANLTDITSAPQCASNPVAYVRGDGINTIVYVANISGGPTGRHIIELRLDNGWKWADLTDISGAPNPLGDISAYVRSDGISTIVYGRDNGHIIELRLDNTWKWADLTYIGGGPGTGQTPRGFVRLDGINAINFESAPPDGGLIYQLYLDNGWHSYELTSVPNAVQGYSPIGYVRADGISAVVYIGGPVPHVQEIRLQTEWRWADLTYIGGGENAYALWPYNRSAVAKTYLPLIRR